MEGEKEKKKKNKNKKKNESADLLVLSFFVVVVFLGLSCQDLLTDELCWILQWWFKMLLQPSPSHPPAARGYSPHNRIGRKEYFPASRPFPFKFWHISFNILMWGTERGDWKERGGHPVHAPAWRLAQLCCVTPDRYLSDILLNTPSAGDTTAYKIQVANENAAKYGACSRLPRNPTIVLAHLPCASSYLRLFNQLPKFQRQMVCGMISKALLK